jgi:hypothetical protein
MAEKSRQFGAEELDCIVDGAVADWSVRRLGSSTQQYEHQPEVDCPSHHATLRGEIDRAVRIEEP